MDKESYLVVSELRDLLMARATGRAGDETPYPPQSGPGAPENYADAYERLRARVLAINRVRTIMPLFVEQYRTLDAFWLFIRPKFAHYSERRAFLQEQFEPVLARLEAAGPVTTDGSMKATLDAKVDWYYVQETRHKALDRRAGDAEAAVTSARTLIKTVCERIVDDAEPPYASHGKIEPSARAALREIVDRLDSEAKPAFEKPVQSSVDLVAAIGSLRNKVGDSHDRGKGAASTELWPAEFAENLAGSLSAFLTQTCAAAKPD